MKYLSVPWSIRTLKPALVCFTLLATLSACSSSSDSNDGNVTDNDQILDDGVNDSDADGISDALDNCPTLANATQVDDDQNGIGDACEDETETEPEPEPIVDTDEDGVADATDNCPLLANAEQSNVDLDAMGDVCDEDDDNDGVTDENDCGPGDQNIFPGAPDDPDDGIDSNCDGQVEQVVQPDIDSDNDGLTDTLELELGLDPENSDTDADGVLDGTDKFPNDPNASLDSDDDGVSDDRDQFPNDATETSDLNGDGLGDNANPFDGTVITGDVSDSTTETPVVAALVSLELVNSNSETNPVVLTTTNAQGSFTLVAEDTLIPDSFVIVVTAKGFQPIATPLSNTGDTIDASGIKIIQSSDNFVIVESRPSVHHLGDDSFSGSQNSQFQRNTEGGSLSRSFNLTADQANQSELALNWVAKGIQSPNTISINGNILATTDVTNVDGSFTKQANTLQVSGVLREGANTLSIESVASNILNDIDDFEFVFIGLSEFD